MTRWLAGAGLRRHLTRAWLARGSSNRNRIGRPDGLSYARHRAALRNMRHRRAAVREHTFGRLGQLEVRLASTASAIAQAQRLRYQVFFEEMNATPSLVARMRRRDQDRYDAVCDHLLVIDHAAGAASAGATDNGRRWGAARRPQVVGTYRVLRQDVAARKRIAFYTQAEYDIAPLMARKAAAGYAFMELGRSCVLKPYRNKRTVELLWHGLWTYVRQHGIDVMIGCASFAGTDPQAHAMALSFLHHQAQAPETWRARTHDHLYQPMDLLPADQVDARQALRAMPPLIKGYLRLGAMIGDGAYIDHDFGTIDVLIILPVERIDPRYFEHFGAPDERTSRVAG